MSQRYKGAVISATPPTVSATSPDPYGTAKGVWTLQQQLQYEGAGTWPSPFTPSYVEDVFSTYLYTGTGTNVNRTITNGVDLSGEGGLVWTKVRDAAYVNALNDTTRGFSNYLVSENTGAQNQYGNLITMTANSDGYTMNDQNGSWNENNKKFVSWTFRKAKKFFDVVTYTGNGNSSNLISHNLETTPGFIIIKRTDSASNWFIYHIGNGTQFYTQAQLNTTDALSNMAGLGWTAPTSTTFAPHYIRDSAGNTANINGANYVAYLFAHNAGGFGDNGNENVISCGSYTFPNNNPYEINLGFEPQWMLYKRADSTSDWNILDVMRPGFDTFGANGNVQAQVLRANMTGAEGTNSLYMGPYSRGFGIYNVSSASTWIYVAIRRGLMKKPTNGTTVYTSTYGTGSSNPAWISSFPIDLAVDSNIGGGSTDSKEFSTRLLQNAYLTINTSAAESAWASEKYDYQNGYRTTNNGTTDFAWMFRRASSFMDVVCYTGTGSATTINHNLNAVPQLIIIKKRGTSGTQWATYSAPTGNTQYLNLDSTNGALTPSPATGYWNSTTPTSTVFSLGNWNDVNQSGATFVAWLFGNCPGVSKIGSYTGTAATLQINCDFTNGARFVLIKRTDSTGNWHVWDSTRGIVAGNDPYVIWNDNLGQTTNTDWVDTYSAGFELSNSAGNNVNINGATYLYLAIA